MIRLVTVPLVLFGAAVFVVGICALLVSAAVVWAGSALVGACAEATR